MNKVKKKRKKEMVADEVVRRQTMQSLKSFYFIQVLSGAIEGF